MFQALSTYLNSFVIQALNGCTSLDPKPVGNVYHHHQSVSDMNTAFAELINKNIDKDIQRTSGERKLRESIDAWNQGKISEEMLQRDIKWSFNPPYGSHQKGIWE